MKHLISLLALIFFSIGISAQQVTNLNDSGPGSLRQAIINASSGTTITFSPSLLANGSDTIKLAFPISFVNGVSIQGLIQGADTLYISGEDSTQIFYIDLSSNPGEVVSFHDLVFVKGRNTHHGGAVFVKDADSLDIENCIFRGNKTIGDFQGGALYLEGITSAILEGVVFDADSTLRSTPTSFLGSGAGLFATSCSNFSVSNSKFERCSSSFRGGGAYLIDCSYTLDGVVFRDNSAVRGGAFGSESGHGLVTNSFVIDNSCLERGGGFYHLYDTTTVVSTLFDRNSSLDYGGGLYMVLLSEIQLVNSSFIQNSSNSSGGAIANSVSYALMSNCTFYYNSAPQSASYLQYGNSPSGSIDNCSFVQHETSNSRIIGVISGTCDVLSSIVLGDLDYVVGSTNYADHIISTGFNIFSDTLSSSLSSDMMNIDSVTLALEPLAMNGGLTPTMLPGPNSVALNMGNPIDFSDAQNGAIFGRRDVGAAERAVIVYDTTLACGTVNWWGNAYMSEGTYRDTLYNANSIDSVGVLVLMNQDTTIYDLDATLYSSETDTNTTYQWVDCGNGYAPISGATSINFLPPANGQYAVILTNQNCVDTSSCYGYNRFSTPENGGGESWLTFYPNPTSGIVQISTSSRLPTQVLVLDMSGREVLNTKIEGNRVDLGMLTKGIYLLRWMNENGKFQMDRVILQ